MKYYIFIPLISYFIALTKAITINLIVQTYFSYAGLYPLMIDDFNNRYVKEKNLDINLKLILFTEENSTFGEDFYSSTVDSILNKKSNKYDVFIYDPLFTRRYSPYFIDLKEYLPEEHMRMYTTNPDAAKAGYYNNQWIGLPIYLKFKLLYSNKLYLDKYGKRVPQTWDELIETAEYILEHEHAENNFGIIGYNALMPKNDITMCSIYEYLYSFRETKDSPMPEFNSERAIEALKKFNKIKDATSSNEILTSDEMFAVGYMFGGVILFSSFFDNIEGLQNYYVSQMPGDIEGIHGSCLTGLNIGVPKHISEEKLKASVEVVKYFTSLEIQKEYFVKLFKCFTAVKSLYDDNEVCSILDCDLGKNIQAIPRPGDLIDDYDSYSIKVINYFYEFLSNTRSIKDILIDIDNLTRIHFFSMNKSPDLIFFIILISLFAIVLLSPCMLFIPKLQNHYQFLSLDGWIFYVIGFLLIIFNEFMNFGELTIVKCNLNNVLFSLGFAFIYTPIIQRLISNIPLDNSFSSWVSSNKMKFNCLVIFMELLYNLLYLSQPYKLQYKITEDDHNHSICLLKSNYGMTINLIQSLIDLFLFMCITVLIFLEWNMISTYKSIRNLTFTVATSAPSILLLIILRYIDIKNFKVIHFIRISVTIAFILTNHIFVFFIRLLLSRFFKNEDNINDVSNKLFHGSKSNGSNNAVNSSVVSNRSDIRSSATVQTKSSSGSIASSYSKLLSCHYATSQI